MWRVTGFSGGHGGYWHRILAPMFSCVRFLSRVGKEGGLISTAGNKLLNLPSLRLLTLLDYISLVIDLILATKACGALYLHFRKWIN